MRSSASSMPHEMRTKPSVMPTLRRSSCSMLACVITEGHVQMLSTAPRFSHRLHGLDGVHQLAPRLGAALDLEPQHGAVHAVQVLPVGELLLREGGEARVPHDVQDRKSVV